MLGVVIKMLLVQPWVLRGPILPTFADNTLSTYYCLVVGYWEPVSE